MHGSNAFIPSTPPRSVLTSSVDLEEFHSSLRQLRKQLHDDTRQVYYSQGMVV